MASFVSFCCARKASVHQLEDLGETHQSLDAVVPFVFFELFVERVALPAWMGFCESCRLDHLERIRGCHEDLRQERVRILQKGATICSSSSGLKGRESALRGGCAPVASGANGRLRATTTASPISRMGTWYDVTSERRPQASWQFPSSERGGYD